MLEPILKVVESDESFVIRYAAPESSTGGADMWKASPTAAIIDNQSAKRLKKGLHA